MHAPDKFCQKLRVSPAVFDKLIERISPHAIFYNNSNNPQLPVPIQLAIFLNGVGHYGNAATTQDLAEWAGVSVGTHHDDAIHFDPLDREDQEERKRSQQWKPGWHGEGFFDKHSNYSLTAQVR
ncbi:hypothetical protein BDR05DRAFT_978547 [Suillus weaverae]|nr:hypothetical protein BDR05DRAFT_978547 [Suillus weaverae]